jgi:predicted phosphoribosyltransferase
MRFASREDGGRQLGRLLRDEVVAVDLVLGLPRGGVVTAAQVAHELQRPLDVLIVRKIGHPWQREFTVGALAEPDVVLLDDDSIGRNPRARAQLDAVIAEEVMRLREYRAKFHLTAAPDLRGKSVLIVDDGLATGATTEAAARAARLRGAKQVIIASPVASVGAVQRLERVADDVRAVCVDPNFEAVGQFYEEFDQTSDDEVIALLRNEIWQQR